MNCTRCEGTGFLNLEQVDDDVLQRYEETGDRQIILDWIDEMAAGAIRAGGGCVCHIYAPCDWCRLQHDVQVCDCCGNGEVWYGEPGQHDLDNPDDPKECR